MGSRATKRPRKPAEYGIRDVFPSEVVVEEGKIEVVGVLDDGS